MNKTYDKPYLVGRFAIAGLIAGLQGGAICGASFGLLWIAFSFLREPFSLLMLGLGFLYGGVIGAVAGIAFGLVNGLGLGLVTGAYFLPLVDARRYRRVCLALSLGVTLTGTIGVSLTTRNVLMLVYLPFVLTVAWWGSRLICNWYVNAHSALRGRT